MLSVVIKGPTYQEAHEQIAKAIADADLVELRLDYFTSLDFEELKNLKACFSIPMIFTLRSGNYPEEKRLKALFELAKLKPEYLDIESCVSPDFIKEIASRQKVILSHHDFESTPDDLEELYQQMQKIPAAFYKIATTAKNSIDALRMLSLAKKGVIAISMGSYGQITRILGPIMGSPITYAALNEEETTAPGQLTIKTLLERYHYRNLSPSTAIYGLIGDPVTLSISDETHNHLIKTCNLDAVYVKMQVTASELPAFFQYARELPFQGLSVTMPLKEEVIPFLDDIDPKAKAIGAVNTLKFTKSFIEGYNTDGMGALNAIEATYSVNDKQMVLIGAGGSAKAIAYEAGLRGAKVTIVNRTKEKALSTAKQLSCTGKGLDDIGNYDILINCTPAPMPIDPHCLIPKTLAMDIKTKPKDTLFLKYAEEKGCEVIHGYRMFVEQALGQFKQWFPEDFDAELGRKVLEKKAVVCLE